MALADFEDYVRRRVETDGVTHRRISEELKERFHGVRGFSIRNIECFCREKGIHKSSRLSESQVLSAVSEAVARVGPTYGQKTLCGLLASDGIKVAENRVGKALTTVNPSYLQARRDRAQHRLNPVPYNASHFGQKLHIDQNEKLVMYGVTHIAAIDGFSGKIVGFISMPVKNNVEIYKHLYRPLLLEYGIWDQLRVDQGKEWVLMLYIQEQLSYFRRDESRPPHRQTSSKLNHIIERVWPEINSRVNYPIKSCLVDMDRRYEFDIDNDAHKFCVSWFSLQVANVGTTMVVNSWNNHRIPGKGVPNRLMASSMSTGQVDPSAIPNSDKAVQQYHTTGGKLTIYNSFGVDPLCVNSRLCEDRSRRFSANIPDISRVFHTLVNGDNTLFHDGLKLFIDLTVQLSSRL